MPSVVAALTLALALLVPCQSARWDSFKEKGFAPDPALVCALQNLTLRMVGKIATSAATVQLAADALQFSRCDNKTNMESFMVSPNAEGARGPEETGRRDVVVDPVDGNDANAGDWAHPVRSLPRALTLTREYGAPFSRMVLREGLHALDAPLELDDRDSQLIITGAAGEHAVLSGAVQIRPQWQPWTRVGQCSMVYRAQLDAGLGLPPLSSLFVDGERAIRARAPNADPERQGLHTRPQTGWFGSAAGWLPPRKTEPATEIHIEEPRRTDTPFFAQFTLGLAGPAAQFDPPSSFWAVASPQGGGASTYTVPSGLVFTRDTLNTTSGGPGGIVHAFHPSGWGSWQFAIDSISPASSHANGSISWSWGGFQEARGATTGGAWHIEQRLELLDSPREYFFDASAHTLYYCPNVSAAPPAEILMSRLDALVVVNGSPDALVHNLTITNVTFAYTRPIYLEAYEVPSGGDVAVRRRAALLAEGTVGLQVVGCNFTRLDNNGLMLSGLAREALIAGNHFSWLGESAMVLVGRSELIDGTRGLQPWSTAIRGNVARELGIFNKQAAAVFQAITARTTIENNVFFNLPRAGICINDGFAGGHAIRANVIFNTVRETNDHGGLNTWDRQPFLYATSNGTALYPEMSLIERNLISNDFNGVWPLDHDDGSSYYTDQFNVLPWGGQKTNMGQHKSFFHNLFIYPDDHGWPGVCELCAPDVGGQCDTERWENNRCLMHSDDASLYLWTACAPANATALIVNVARNQFYTPGGKSVVQCGNVTFDFARWQQAGADPGSSVSPSPSVAQILHWAEDLLQLP